MAGATAVLRIEHPVPDYETWKRKGFDRDPIGREEHGVRRYRVLRPTDDAKLVAIELEFDDRAAAEAFATSLVQMWQGVQERFRWRELPATRIYELAASSEHVAIPSSAR